LHILVALLKFGQEFGSKGTHVQVIMSS